MKLHWNDIIDDDGNWSHLQIEVDDQPVGNFQIHSGGNLRFSLTRNELTVFWGCIEFNYYGAWILRNNFDWEKQNMIIPPITSNQIENYKCSNQKDKIIYWSRFFIDSLMKSENTFLYDGKWKISQGFLKWKRQKLDLFEKWIVFETDNVFTNSQLTYLDWGINGSGNLVALKDTPNESEGRVKWWRKKVKEGTCPPILAWYINSLDAFIIIDGHRRLKAYQLENIEPEILVLNTMREEYYPKDMTRRENIVKSIEIRQNHPSKAKLSIDDINSILIEAYDERPSIRPITKSIAQADFEEIWINDVKKFRNQPNIDQEELEAMLKNE
ncbi:MAG: hypothetical protein IPO21_09165 [Bacteroidales bacterium]|nr:hypothetical protein [Bacteroidales bacterium]